MWLHVLNDGKFVPRIRAQFDAVAPGENRYVISEPEADGRRGPAELVPDAPAFRRLLESRGDWSGVIFNPLGPQCWPWLAHIPPHIPVLWYLWGYEAYSTYPPLKRRHRYLPETRRMMRREGGLPALREWSRGIREILTGRFRPLGRVDFLVSPDPGEFELFRRYRLLSRRTRWAFGMVGCLEECTRGQDRAGAGRDIVVGNSADPTNNHVEAFRWLSRFDLSDRRVLVPLSYGRGPLTERILEIGSELLGSSFSPLDDFLPLSEYNAVLGSSGMLVMNHVRQQAFSNIVAGLYRGARVVMNPTTLYRFLVKWGLSVELMRDVDPASPFAAKTRVRVESDRRILESRIGRDVVHAKTRELLEACRSMARKG